MCSCSCTSMYAAGVRDAVMFLRKKWIVMGAVSNS